MQLFCTTNYFETFLVLTFSGLPLTSYDEYIAPECSFVMITS